MEDPLSSSEGEDANFENDNSHVVDLPPLAPLNLNPEMLSHVAIASTEFPQYHVQNKVIVSLESEECYVFATSINNSQQVIAASGSNNIIKLYDTNTMTVKSHLVGHTDTINEIHFAKTHTDVLYSCSSDRTIRLWDTRENKPGPVYKGTSEYWSVGVNNNDSLLASGHKNDIVIWDVRSSKQLRRYSDFHGDDINQVRFHPHDNSNRLFTASQDGTICAVDYTVDEEEDALMSGFNIEDPISRIDFVGPLLEYITVLSSSERLSMWTLDGVRVFDYGDKRAEISTETFPIQYFICCCYDKQHDQLYLVGGNHEGGLGLLNVLNNNEIRPVTALMGGHMATVRSLEWDLERQVIVTTGEDARMCVWNTQPPPPSGPTITQPSGKMTMKQEKKQQGSSSRKPY